MALAAGIAAIVAAGVGLFAALIAWLVYAKVGYGEINKDNLFEVGKISIFCFSAHSAHCGHEVHHHQYIVYTS